MSGHSKWKNIMHRKEKSDAARAKVFTKIGRELALAVREGGGADPNANSRLRDAILKAKQNNVPNDNIERIIKKAAGSGEGDNYEAITYEGYGPCGVAVIVETLTDNRNRTAADIRHYFDKYGGNMGTSGSVSWMFTEKGLIVADNVTDADALMLDALDAGAEDITEEEGGCLIYTAISDLAAVRDALMDKGVEIVSSEREMVPSTTVTVAGEDNLKNLSKLMEMLEDNDDVQNVFHNWGSEDN